MADYPDFVSSTGYGTGEGLGGWNCRHSFYPFFPGISASAWSVDDLANIDPPPFEFQGKQYTRYEATQTQRQIERDMRQLKRQLVAYDSADARQDFQNSSIKLQRYKQMYRDFSNAAGLPYRWDKTWRPGFTKSIAQTSYQSAQAHHRDWLKDIGATGTEIDTIKKYYQAKGAKSGAYQILMDYNKRIAKGELSPLTGLETYIDVTAEADNKLIGIETADGVKIESVHPHFVARVLGTEKRQGVPIEDVIDALQHPILRTPHGVGGDHRITYRGKNCEVAVSIDDKRIIQTNPWKGKK